MIGISSFETLYQTYYPDERLPYLTPKNAVLLNAFLNGNTDGRVSGDQIDMPWLGGPSTGVSQSYDQASARANVAPLSLRPTVRMSQVYKNLAFLDKDDVLSRGEASYGELMETVIFGAREDFLNNVDALFHLSGDGVVMAVQYTTTGAATLTVATSPQGLNNGTTYIVGAPVSQTVLEVNDQVVFTTTTKADGTAPTLANNNVYTVTSVDDLGGTFTVNTDPGLTNTYWYGVAKVGNTLGFTSALLNPSIIGVAAFNPYGGVSTTDNFLGVNRSTYGSRFAGSWFDASSNYSMEQGCKKIATKVANTGVEGEGAFIALHPDDMDTMDFSVTSQNRYSQHQLGEVFFNSLAINSSLGRLDCILDRHQQKGFARVYLPGAIQLMYRGSLPGFATLNTGLDEQWGQNYDGREKRMRAYLQLRCRDPRKLGVAKLATV